MPHRLSVKVVSVISSKDRSPWRQKYLELVQEHDLLQRQFQQREDLLQRGLKKITIAAKGQDIGLDASIDAFRQALSDSSNEELDTQIKKLDDSIHYFDRHKLERNINLAEAIAAILQRFQTLNISAADNRQINKFSKQLIRASKNSHESIDIYLWLEKLNSIHASVLKNYLLSDTFIESVKRKPEIKTVSVSEHSAKEDIPLEQHKQDVQVNDMPAEAVSILLAMLAEMDIPAEAEQFTAPLYYDLQKGSGSQGIASTLDRFAVILSATLNRDHQEFDAFLRSLDDDVAALTANTTFSEQNQKLADQQFDNFFQQLYPRLDSLDVHLNSDNVETELRHINFLFEDVRLDQVDQKNLAKKRLVAAKNLLGEISSRLDLAVANLQQRRDKLLRDKLTGLPSSDAFSLRIRQEYERWQRYQRPLTIVAVNIDKLKRLNQEFGYHVGDRVIAVIAAQLQINIRKTDFIARAMSCDFYLLLPELSGSQVNIVLDKFSECLSHCNFDFADQAAVTLSLGATDLQAGDDVNSAIRRAEKALSVALSKGGNRSYSIN